MTPVTNLHMTFKLTASVIKITPARSITATEITNGYVAVKLKFAIIDVTN
jgi:hypothetical protein